MNANDTGGDALSRLLDPDRGDFDAKKLSAALSRALPDLQENHVPEDVLWYLADPEIAAISEELRPSMDHAFSCRRCYTALVECRTALVEPVEGESELAAVAEEAWDRVRAIHFKVLLAFAIAGAGRGGKLRITLGGAKGMRMLSDTGNIPAETIERDLGSPWEFQRAFGDYSFRIVLTPRDFERRTVEVSLIADAVPEGALDNQLRAELAADDGVIGSFSFVNRQVALGTLPLRNYRIAIENMATGQIVGLVELAIDKP